MIQLAESSEHPAAPVKKDDSVWLRQNLEQAFMLPKPAVDWLLMVWGLIQVFDDVADGDAVDRKDLDQAIWDCFVGFHRNQFFCSYSQHLTPVLASAVLKWKASDTAEREGNANEKSYMWRAGFYDLVLSCIELVHGHQGAMNCAHKVMELYGETCDEYLKEF